MTSFHSAAFCNEDCDPLVDLRFRELLVESNAEGDVVVDRHRERCRLLKHHADARAQQIQILLRRQDVCAVEHHLAFGPLVGIEVVHAVENPQQRRLSATGGTDEGCDLAVIERQRDVFQRKVRAVVELQIPDRDTLGALSYRSA